MKQLSLLPSNSNDYCDLASRRSVSRRLIAFLVLLPMGFASMGAAASLTVKIEGIEKLEGVLLIRLVDSPETFEQGGSVATLQIKVAESSHTFMLDGLPEGTYALRLMHDLNGNQELDKNVVGIPKEPYAFSNNAKANFGPPKFEAAAFEIVAGANQTTVSFSH